jgi:flagellar hook-associated protein 1 FlgK
VSTFSGLSIGLSSLYAQRRGLELTGHNVANANTEGYSRQRVRLQGEGGPITPAMHSVYHGVGNGVSVVDTQRLRDSFLDGRAAVERGTDGALRGQQAAYARLEGILTEPSGSGLQSQLDDFWSGWDAVAISPAEPAARSQLLERAHTLATGLNGATGRMEVQWSSSRDQLLATVREVNAIADDVATFNTAIRSAVLADRSANDLMDRRDVLVQQLAEKVGATVRPGANGTTDVVLGTVALVSGTTAQHLSVSGATSLAGVGLPTPGDGPVTVTAGGTAVTVSGAAGGLRTELNAVLPSFHSALGGVVSELRDRVNAQHTAGFDQSGVRGTDFFALDPVGRLGVLVTGPGQVAASSVQVPGGDRGGANAVAMAELSTRGDGPNQTYRRLIVDLGVRAQSANRQVDIQSNILGQLDAAREAEAGVSLDEEMTNMLAYQRAYEGAARFVTAVDQMLDTIINRTGLVGR